MFRGVVTVIQARRASTRLPGKVLLPLGGTTVLERQIERVRAASLAGIVTVATTTDPGDDAIEAICDRVGIPCVRGHATDLLERHRQAAAELGARHIVKVPSDCPLIDPEIIDAVIAYYLAHEGELDYASNLHPATWPDGNDVEIMSRAALETAAAEARRPHEREHTTPFLWDRPERFRIGNVRRRDGRDQSATHRVVLDYAADYSVISHVFEALFEENPAFGSDDVVRWLDAHPRIAAMNSGYRGVNWYRHHLDELRTVSAAETREPLEARA
ncbi:MAG TPA: glycosyltransferase family protein [Gemmatimonadaceae bacterium]|nr:glycosyltransferase family protein [Gemmatimonadaceae bacterium]